MAEWWEADDLAAPGASAKQASAPAAPWWDTDQLVETAKGLPSAIHSLATGSGRTEFPDMPELGTSGPEVGAFSSKGLRMLGAYLSTTDPEAIADIAVKTLPLAKRRNDKFGNPIITVFGEDYYINSPGFSEADAFQLTGMLAEFMPAARFGAGGTSILRRMGRTGPAFAATSGILDAAAGGLGSEQGVDLPKAAIVGGLGAAAEVVAPAAKALWNSLRRNPRFVDPATGKATEEGRRAAIAAGVPEEDFAILMAENERLAAEYAAETVRPTQGKYSGIHAEGREFGIDYTAGQAEYAGSLARGGVPKTGQIRMEEAMAGGRFGDAAEQALRAKRSTQREQVLAAGERIQDDLAGGMRRIESPAEAGELVGPGIEARAATQDANVQAAYEAAGAKDMRFTAEGVGGMFRSVRQGLRKAGVVIEDKSQVTKLYPATARAFSHLVRLSREVAKRKGFPQITKQSLARFELIRRRIGADIGAAKTQADKRGAVTVKREYDNWLDDAVDNALFEGDADALELLKEARSLRTDYGRTFQGKDEAGRIISKILQEQPTAEQTINLILGRAALGSKDASAKTLARLREIFGADSPEWASLREAGWLRLFRNRKGEVVSPKVFHANVNRVRYEAPAVMRELFSTAETNQMARFGKAALRTLTPDDLVNSSRTADALSHWFRQILGRMGTRATFSGDPIQAAGLHAIARTPNFFGGRQARRLINPKAPPLSAPRLTAGAGAVGR